MAQVKGITKTYGPELVLRNITFNLGRGQKIALIGPNGVGKSTLLQILAGIVQPDEGLVELNDLPRIGYLPQQIVVESEKTVEEYIKDVVGISPIEKELDELSNTNDSTLADQIGSLQETYEALGGYELSHRIRKIFAGIGLKDIQSDRQLNQLSGGQKTRVAIAAILLRGQDLLLLDEPTNNLDLEAIEWLEGFVIQSEATCIVISHDTRFLDAVTEKVFEIDPFTKQVTEYTGNYSDYAERRGKAENRLREAFRLQKDEVERLEKVVSRQKAWAVKGARQVGTDNDKFLRGFRRDRATKSASRAKAVEKRLSQIERIELPKKQSDLAWELDSDIDQNRFVIGLSNAVMGFASQPVLKDVTLSVLSGQKIVIIGDNGSGKTTLLRSLIGEIPILEGLRQVNQQVSFGYFPQDHDNFPRDILVREFFNDLSDKVGSEKEWRQTLRLLRINESSHSKRIGDLSPGMRAKLLLAAFALLGHDTLILDEPTNHLDLDTVTELKAVLAAFSGTVIASTHDRNFIETLQPDFIWDITDNTVVSSPYTEANE